MQELAQEPDFVAAAEIMRTRLLSPVSEAAVEEGAATVGRRPPAAILGHRRGRRRPVEVFRRRRRGRHARYGDRCEHIRPFATSIWCEKDFTGTGNGDSDGHGTHCAGILFGRNVDGVRIGVAPGVRRALIGKILERSGGDSDMLIRGVSWAHEEGAHVISMSVGFDFAATVEERLEQGWIGELATAVTLEAYRANLRLLDRLLQMLRMQEPFTGGAIVVAAAGNDSSRGSDGEYIMSACPPSGSDKIISVGSLDPDPLGKGYRVSSFSNSGVEITAPGREITSAAAGGGLKVLSGTSVAAPHVAGVAALWWQAVRQSDLPANATVVRGKLVGSAQAKGFSPAVYPSERGAGRAFAPQDGLASLLRDRPRSRPRRGDAAWAGRPRRPADARISSRFRSISEGVVQPASTGGRSLC